jgi:hypothetical protein
MDIENLALMVIGFLAGFGAGIVLVYWNERRA